MELHPRELVVLRSASTRSTRRARKSTTSSRLSVLTMIFFLRLFPLQLVHLDAQQVRSVLSSSSVGALADLRVLCLFPRFLSRLLNIFITARHLTTVAPLRSVSSVGALLLCGTVAYPSDARPQPSASS